MTPRTVPTVRDLERDEVEEILARNRVGRIAYGRGSRIDIEPIHYVYADGWIYGRTSDGPRLETNGFSWWPVAFEVDEVDDLYRWRTVVVHGGFYTIPPDGVEWARSVELLSGLVPARDGAASARDVLFRIAVQEAAGRESSPGANGRSVVPAPAEPVPA